MRLFLRIFISAVIFVASSPAAADQSPEYFKALEDISAANKIKPWQQSDNERAQDVLDGSVLDEKNKVVGEVRDLLLAPSGGIDQIDVNLNRLRLGPLTLNYSALGFQAVGSGYKANYTDQQIKDMYPQLLAGVETASGGAAASFSLRKILGSTLQAEDGRVLGRITDVVFNDLGRRAAYLYVETKSRNMTRKNLVIPFSAPHYSAGGAHPKIMLNNAAADALVEYSQTH